MRALLVVALLAALGVFAVTSFDDPSKASQDLASAANVGLPEAGAQDDRSDPKVELDKLVGAAINGRAVVKPQAARRIVRLWTNGDEDVRAMVIARMQAEIGADNASLAKVNGPLIEVLGRFEDEALRARLWQAVDDRDFPWRPYAVKALAATPLESEHERLRNLLADPIGDVRGAALTAMRNLAQESDAPAVRVLLADPLDYVRREAATLLAEWGHEDALWLLFEELKREDWFFDRPTGNIARFQAYRQLLGFLGDLGDIDASQGPEKNKAALEEVAGRIRERAGDPIELAPTAVATGTERKGVMGLELRSCRRGNFWIRWTRDDHLMVGEGTPATIKLPEGTVAKLLQSGAVHTGAVEARMTGQAGCDLEMFHWRPERTPTMWIVSKGADPIPNLRPAPLSTFARELLSTLPDEESDDPRMDRLQSRLLDALEVVGGSIAEK